MTTFLTLEQTLEPDEELTAFWCQPSGALCQNCQKPITHGENDAGGVCTACYFQLHDDTQK